MAYQTGGGGYGGVYRPLPNIAQTVRPPLASVGDPPLPALNPVSVDAWPSAYWQTPWPWAAMVFHARVREVPPLPVGPDPVPFPKLGQWLPTTMDPPDLPKGLASYRLRLMPIGPDPVRFPFLGGWTPGIMDPPPTTVRTRQVRPPLAAIGNPPVAFPTLGQWTPTAPPDVTVQLAQFRLRLLSVGDPPALFSLAGTPMQVPGWPLVAVEQRLPITPQVLIIPGIAYPTPPAWYALHWPAYLRDWPIPLLTQRLASLPVGAPSVPFPQLGGWPVGIMDAPSTRIQVATRPLLTAVGDSPALFPAAQPPWMAAGPSAIFFAQRLPLLAVPLILSVPYPTPAQWYGMHAGAYLRDVSPAFLQRAVLLPVGGDSVAFPSLGGWTLGSMVPRWPLELLAQRLLPMPLGADPVAFSAVQSPWTAPPWPLVQLAQRLPVTPPILIISGIAYPTPPQWMALHAAAFLRDWSIPTMQHPITLPVGGDPIAFPKLGQFQPRTMLPPDASAQYAAFRIPLAGIGAPPVAFPPRPTLSLANREPYPLVQLIVSRRVYTVGVVTFLVVELTDGSVVAFELTDASIAAIDTVDQSGPAGQFLDASMSAQQLGDESTPADTLTDESLP